MVSEEVVVVNHNNKVFMVEKLIEPLNSARIASRCFYPLPIGYEEN
jgi:hypothetical protein